MIKTIKLFLGNLFGTTFAKEDVLEGIENNKKFLDNSFIQNYEVLIEQFKTVGVNREISNEILKFGKQLGISASKPVDVVIEIKNFLKELSDNIQLLETKTDKYLPDYITDKTITYRITGIMGTVNNFSSITLYSYDLLLYFIYGLNKDDMYFSKKKMQIMKQAFSFQTIYKEYRHNVRKILKNIDSLSDNKIMDVESIRLTSTSNDMKFKLPANGFIGNPIYHFRLWLVDREIKKYEALKDKKQLFELKILELKNKQINEPNPNLEKQIEWYEDQVSKLEYRITEIEEDV